MEASVKLTLIAKDLEFLTFYYIFLLQIEILKFQGSSQRKEVLWLKRTQNLSIEQ
jgi:hypothetical protein